MLLGEMDLIKAKNNSSLDSGESGMSIIMAKKFRAVLLLVLVSCASAKDRAHFPHPTDHSQLRLFSCKIGGSTSHSL